MESRVLSEAFHIYRLKLAFVSTAAGTVNTHQELNKVIQSTTLQVP